MFELIHTSAPRGLIEGRSGYTPVAWTEGFPINLLPLIENLSAYDFVSSSPDAAAKTPELYSYRKIKFGAGELRVVSRIAFAGLDYSGRVNKIAHHLIFTDAAEMARFGGAVRIALATDNFTREFHGEPRLLSPRLPRAAEPTAGGAECWRRFAGDPGWSVVVARAFRDTPERAFLSNSGRSARPRRCLNWRPAHWSFCHLPVPTILLSAHIIHKTRPMAAFFCVVCRSKLRPPSPRQE